MKELDEIWRGLVIFAVLAVVACLGTWGRGSMAQAIRDLIAPRK